MNYGRYRIIKEIGEGTMATVYQAHDPTLDIMVALKVLRRDKLGSDAFIRRFLADARALGRLDHPNIVRVYNVDEDRGTVYIVMEYVEGEPLSKVMEQKQFSLNETIRLGIVIAETLNYAHHKGIVHRDVKPSNILLSKENRLKMADFGIAHMEDPSGMQQTLAGEILGTPSYMSPDHIMGRSVDGRCDLFSLGIILYELCTGKRPFGGENIPAVFREITHLNPPVPSRLNPQVTKELSHVIMKCLMKNPGDRYKTGKELAEDLNRCLNKCLHVNRVPRWRKKVFIAVGMVCLLVMSIVAADYILKPKEPDKSEPSRVDQKITGSAINVQSTPAGAEIFIDGVSKGNTPSKVDMPPGSYEVKLTLSNHYDWEALVRTNEGSETPLFVHLMPIEEKKDQ
jgi:eukaryotic-like serine/threonine-protein kinase